MGLAERARAKNRKIIVHDDGTAFQIRRLRESDFVAQNMLVVAAQVKRAEGDSDAQLAYIEQYLREHPTEFMHDLEVAIVTKGVVGLAERRADDSGWVIEPVAIMGTPTDKDGELYYLDLGGHFKWLVQQIRAFTDLTPEAAAAQDKFPAGARSAAASDEQDVRGTAAPVAGAPSE